MNNILRGYRKMLSISQTDMANILGMALTSYNQRESGKLDFTQTEMYQIMRLLKEKLPQEISNDLSMEKVFFRS